MHKQYSFWSESDDNQIEPQLTTTERDAKVVALMKKFFEQAANKQFRPLDVLNEQKLKKVFASDIWGFREILLVIVIARLLNKQYKASVDLYECRPRALFEGPIRSVLRENGIPHRQSGPLNIAKGTKMINSQWAAGRRPKSIADIIVELVAEIENMSREDLENFVVNLHAHFLIIKREVEILTIETRPQADPDYLYQVCEHLINEAPDYGNTPQKITGLLLQAYHETFSTGIEVSGFEDRASTTSTTSKKLGDIAEKGKNISLIYEVTIKPFEGKRVIDAYNAARSFDAEKGTKTQEIIVLCREADCHPDIVVDTDTVSYFGKIAYKDIVFYFQNIYEWIMTQILKMPSDGRLMFHKRLEEYIVNYNTSTAVKRAWSAFHEERHQ